MTWAATRRAVYSASVTAVYSVTGRMSLRDNSEETEEEEPTPPRMTPRRRVVPSRLEELEAARIRSPSSPEEPLKKQPRLEEDAGVVSLFRAISAAVNSVCSDENLLSIRSLISDTKIDLSANWPMLGQRTLFQYACTGASSGKEKVIAALLDAGASATAIDEGGNTALHDVIFHGADAPLVALLLAHGGDPSAANETGHTPVHFAASFGSLEVLETLLRAGGSCRSVTEHRLSPLHCAANRPSAAHCELLIEYGADPDSANDEDLTPLSVALSRGYLLTVHALLRKGAQPSQGDFALARLHLMEAELLRACGRRVGREGGCMIKLL